MDERAAPLPSRHVDRDDPTGSTRRTAYDSDIAVARACQYNIIRLAADLERLCERWLAAHPDVPWRLIKGTRNRIAHNYWTVDDNIVCQRGHREISSRLRPVVSSLNSATQAARTPTAART